MYHQNKYDFYLFNNAHNRHGRVNFFSKEEMQRRLNLVQSRMDELGAAALLIPRPPCYTDPNVTWMTGARERGMPELLVFRDGQFARPGPPPLPDVNVLEKPSMSMTESLFLRNIGDVRKNVPSAKKLAFIGVGAVDAQFLDKLEEAYPGVEFVDMTRDFVEFRAVKSEEEIAAVREAVYVQDKVFESLPYIVYPGRTMREIAADMNHIMRMFGSDFAGAANPQTPIIGVEMHPGTSLPAQSANNTLDETIHYPGYRLTGDEWFQLCICGHGAGSYSAQKSRNIYLRQPDDRVYDLWNMAVAAQDLTASLMKPKAKLDKVYREVNEWLLAQGCDKGTGGGFVCGQGVEWNEYPHMDRRDSPDVTKNMVYSMSPCIFKDGYFDFFQDTYLVEENGSVCLSRIPREIIVIS